MQTRQRKIQDPPRQLRSARLPSPSSQSMSKQEGDKQRIRIRKSAPPRLHEQEEESNDVDAQTGIEDGETSRHRQRKSKLSSGQGTEMATRQTHSEESSTVEAINISDSFSRTGSFSEQTEDSKHGTDPLHSDTNEDTSKCDAWDDSVYNSHTACETEIANKLPQSALVSNAAEEGLQHHVSHPEVKQNQLDDMTCEDLAISGEQVTSNQQGEPSPTGILYSFDESTVEKLSFHPNLSTEASVETSKTLEQDNCMSVDTSVNPQIAFMDKPSETVTKSSDQLSAIQESAKISSPHANVAVLEEKFYDFTQTDSESYHTTASDNAVHAGINTNPAEAQCQANNMDASATSIEQKEWQAHVREGHVESAIHQNLVSGPSKDDALLCETNDNQPMVTCDRVTGDTLSDSKPSESDEKVEFVVPTDAEIDEAHGSKRETLVKFSSFLPKSILWEIPIDAQGFHIKRIKSGIRMEDFDRFISEMAIVPESATQSNDKINGVRITGHPIRIKNYLERSSTKRTADRHLRDEEVLAENSETPSAAVKKRTRKRRQSPDTAHERKVKKPSTNTKEFIEETELLLSRIACLAPGTIEDDLAFIREGASAALKKGRTISKAPDLLSCLVEIRSKAKKRPSQVQTHDDQVVQEDAGKASAPSQTALDSSEARIIDTCEPQAPEIQAIPAQQEPTKEHRSIGVTANPHEKPDGTPIDYQQLRNRLVHEDRKVSKVLAPGSPSSMFRPECINTSTGMPIPSIKSWKTCSLHVAIAFYVAQNRIQLANPKADRKLDFPVIHQDYPPGHKLAIKKTQNGTNQGLRKAASQSPSVQDTTARVAPSSNGTVPSLVHPLQVQESDENIRSGPPLSVYPNPREPLFDNYGLTTGVQISAITQQSPWGGPPGNALRPR